MEKEKKSNVGERGVRNDRDTAKVTITEIWHGEDPVGDCLCAQCDFERQKRKEEAERML